jgi:putative alpha-1,2-mannosidase
LRKHHATALCATRRGNRGLRRHRGFHARRRIRRLFARDNRARARDDPASLVNPLIGTTGGGNVFPGPDMSFGMIQWGPDTASSRPDGGGYSYTAGQITGYSLTHLSGPGCGAYGDAPILPTTGAVGSNPAATTETLRHSQETAQAGYGPPARPPGSRSAPRPER